MPDLEAALREELKATGGRLFKAARNLDFDLDAAKLRLNDRRRVSEITLGRVSLRKYIVAYRSIYGDWPREFREALADARKKFDAGTHEMCQGRDGQHIIQYLIPRLVRTKPRRFFGGIQ